MNIRIDGHPQQTTDSLTGLATGGHFHALLEIELERVRRYGGSMALLLLDIDDFRHFNARYGHDEGDRLLVRLAATLRHTLRKIDTACRYGGEEFIVLLPGCDRQALPDPAERLRRELAVPAALADGRRVSASVSIGAACCRGSIAIDCLIRELDTALACAKRGGKNRIELAG